MKRREFITLLGGVAAALPVGAKAQLAVKPPRVGYLAPGSASKGLVARDQAFREGLRDLGYVDIELHQFPREAWQPPELTFSVSGFDDDVLPVDVS